MVKHVVTWKLKSEALGNSKEQNAKKIKEILEALQGKIDGLVSISVGINSYVDKDPNADVVLFSVHESFEALAHYQAHPLHNEAASFVKEAVEYRMCVDFEE